MKKKILIFAQSNITKVKGGSITATINLSEYLSSCNYEVICIYHSKEDINKIENINFKLINLYKRYNKMSYSDSVNLFLGEYIPDLMIFVFSVLSNI